MDGMRDFSLDPAAYPEPEMARFIRAIRDRGMRWVYILDPCEHSERGGS